MRDGHPTPKSGVPLVFSEEWLAHLRKRFAGKHDYQTTYVYRLATHPDAAPRRRGIEAWVAALSDGDQRKVIPRLRSNENHHQTYHELAVGALLVEAGLSVRYEEGLVGSIAPDWAVRNDGGQLLMVVEVLTVNPPGNQIGWQRAIDEIFARLVEVPVGFALGVDVDDPDVVPDQQQLKLIESRVRQWLTTSLPPVGSTLRVQGATLIALAHNPDWKGVQVAGPARAFRVDYDGLAQKLSAKVRKYGDAASGLHIPLVLAVITDSATGHDVQTIDHVLNGRPSYECLFDKPSGDILGTRFVRREDALFDVTPKLSAVFSAWPVSGGWNMSVTRNPKAEAPLGWREPPNWMLRIDH
jgi:hypothetical protein